MDFTRTFIPSRYRSSALVLVISLLVSAPSYGFSNSEAELENDYQIVTARIYRELSKTLTQCRTSTYSFKTLPSTLQRLSLDDKGIVGICLLRNHLAVLKKNIDQKEIFDIFRFLLDNNNLSLANQLLTHAKNEGDKSLLSNISFIFSRYYVKRKEWTKVLQFTKDIFNDLTFEDANLARLYRGIALQKMKKHREAVKQYITIPLHSNYFPAARLNIATAYIRQDWWTDAHAKINEVINNHNIITNREMINRLYLVLGYSLLRKEFYRDSREAFRSIEIDSKYFNKALLGIALTATNQQDYVGALNAVNILRKKKDIDLSVDESHLLLPYIYEKLHQSVTASASYSDALKYYQNRIKDVLAIKNSEFTVIQPNDILNQKSQLLVKNNIIDYSKHFSTTFLENASRLKKLKKYLTTIKNPTLTKELKSVNDKYNKLFEQKLTEIYDARLSYLHSYMNQARFGMARLFDNSNTAAN